MQSFDSTEKQCQNVLNEFLSLLIQDWFVSTSELRIESEVVERVDNFTYLGSLISPNGLVSDEISARIHKARLAYAKLRHNGLVSDEISARIRKARLAFANLRHLWRRRDIRLSIKGRVYCAAVRSVLIYGSKTRMAKARYPSIN
ncbi:unnamed protein product [Schistosoma mattheei]|uniref:Uncharacterized protein n=1 Tax=Schistosoma mattheei TaxID=31246 RepID=A0A183NR75_9TREM|nr:unnamed protein product [Schistosoma mattheei]